MITNDRQYKITRGQIEKFQEALEQFSSNASEQKDVHPLLIEAQRQAMIYQLNQLLKEAAEYEELKAGKIYITEVKDFSELPIAIIKSRIANGLTQAELADLLSLKEQQVQRYEADKYETASLKTLLKVADALKIKINADVQIKEVEAPDIFDVKHYPFRQMFQRKWFPNFHGSLNEAVKNSATLIENLYVSAGVQNFQQVFNRKSVRTGSTINEFALNIWYARVISKAREQELDVFFDKTNVSDEWLKSLVGLSVNETGPSDAIYWLRDNGIRVVIEPALEGTHLDGAALLMDNIYPIIALTLRHDRLDNFWFVLLHELAHIVLHIGNLIDMIFDDLDANVTDTIEVEADKYSLNAAIPDLIWRRSLVRFSPSKETIINQARTFNVHTALIAGRIRKETGKYFQFSDLVGQNEVRKYLTNEFDN